MKARWPFIMSGGVAIVIVIISFVLLHPVSHAPQRDVSVSLLGYTNSLGTNMALLQVTNGATGQFVCFVGPRVSVASSNGHPLQGDLYPAAEVQAVLKAPGAFTIAVVSSPDTNLWRVSVQLQEVDMLWPEWKRRLARSLGKIGIHLFEPRSYHVTSPAFRRGER